jgi:hypothetical protein
LNQGVSNGWEKTKKSQGGLSSQEDQKGKLGELSKVQEELDEAADAEAQHCRVMLLVELSDIVGAIESYLEKHMPDFTLADLRRMSKVTKRAFRSGFRR